MLESGEGSQKVGRLEICKKEKIAFWKKKRKKESKKLIHKLNTNNIHIFQIFEKIIVH